MATKTEKAIAKAAVEQARMAKAPAFEEATQIVKLFACRAKDRGVTASSRRDEAAQVLRNGTSARWALSAVTDALQKEGESVAWGEVARKLFRAPADEFRAALCDALDDVEEELIELASWMTGYRFGADGDGEALARQGRIAALREIRTALRTTARDVERNGLLDDRDKMSGGDRADVEAMVAVALMRASSYAPEA